MGVFGAVFGRRGDAGFSSPLLGVSSGVVGFNVPMLSRLVREKVRPARSKHPKFGVFALAGRVFSRQLVLRRSWMQRGALQAGCGGGFALHEALLRRVVGVSEPHVVQFPRGVMPGRF